MGLSPFFAGGGLEAWVWDFTQDKKDFCLDFGVF